MSSSSSLPSMQQRSSSNKNGGPKIALGGANSITGDNAASNDFKFDVGDIIYISDKHSEVRFKGQTGKVTARRIEGKQKKRKIIAIIL